MCTWNNACDFSKHKYQTAWPLDYFTVLVSVSSLFPTSSITVSACVHTRGFWIYLHFTERTQWRDAKKQTVCGLTTMHVHVCECVKVRHRETELSAVRRVCVPSEVYFCLAFSCNTRANLSMKHVKERSSQKPWLITDGSINWMCFLLQTFTGRCLDMGHCICVYFLMLSALSHFLLCVCVRDCTSQVSHNTYALIQSLLSPTRNLICQGNVLLQTGLQTQERFLILFTDLLIITKAKYGGENTLRRNKIKLSNKCTTFPKFGVSKIISHMLMKAAIIWL